MWTSISRKMYIYMSTILIIGIIIGTVFVFTLDEATKEILFLNINNYLQNINKNNICILLEHLIIFSSLFVLSIFIIGAPLIIFFIFYNGFTIGFIISSIASIFGTKGVLFGIVYVLISKLLFLVLLILFSVNLFKIVKYMIDYIIYKKNTKEYFNIYIKRSILFIGIVLLNDIILYFWGIKLVNIFNFLIK